MQWTANGLLDNGWDWTGNKRLSMDWMADGLDGSTDWMSSAIDGLGVARWVMEWDSSAIGEGQAWKWMARCLAIDGNGRLAMERLAMGRLVGNGRLGVSRDG